MGRKLDMLDWEKNFAVIVRKSNTSIFRDLLRDLNDIETALGHAVMVLRINGKLYYRGYRPLLNQTIREVLALNDNRKVIDFFRRKVFPAEVHDERRMYQLRHKECLLSTGDTTLAYREWDYNEDERRSILDLVKQDENRKKKYYKLAPDEKKEIDKHLKDEFIHNCVTWIIETQHKSVNRLLLVRVDSGNISDFADKLQETGDANETETPD